MTVLLKQCRRQWEEFIIDKSGTVEGDYTVENSTVTKRKQEDTTSER